jgi:thioredoxin-like negative regulator of GroEL
MSAPVPLTPQLLAAEKRATELLDHQKWRKARDELKPLVKVDRARYLPLLVRANIGLGKEMLAKGQIEEAKQVIGYLRTIASPEQLRGLELDIACISGATTGVLPSVVALLAENPDSIPEQERVRLADLLVLTFQPIPSATPSAERIAAEVRCVHDALHSISQGQWQQVANVCRSIPRRSCFSHWALFLKGVAAFHAGNDERMEQCFRDLPPGSVTAKAAHAYRQLNRSRRRMPEHAPLSEQQVEAVCRLAGIPSAAHLLFLAEQAWRNRQYEASYRVLRDAVPHFPTVGQDWLGALTEFYFHVPGSLSEDERTRYLEYFQSMANRHALKVGVERMLVQRIISLEFCDAMPAPVLRDRWESFLREHQALHGENRRLASVAYAWLGEKLSMVEPSFGIFARREPLYRDAPGAIEALEKSIQLDPANLRAHVHLCALHTRMGAKAQQNRLLDEMTARFPDDKRVLLTAAAGCMERKAFTKALNYLQRARLIDPLDPELPTMEHACRRRLAREQFKGGQASRARRTLALTEATLTDRPDDYHRNRWTSTLRHGIMESLWGDAKIGEDLLAKSRAAAPAEVDWILFAHLTHRVYTGKRPGITPFSEELEAALGRSPTVANLARWIAIIRYWKMSPETVSLRLEERLLARTLESALSQPFTREDAILVIERAQGDCTYERGIDALIQKVLKRDPLDPWFRLHNISEHPLGKIDDRTDSEINAIIREATRRNDDPTVRKARQLLEQLRRRDFLDGAGPDFDDEYEGEDEDDDATGMPVPKLPPEALALFAETIKSLRGLTPDAAQKLIDSMPPGMPPELLNALIESAKASPSPAHPLPPQGRGRGKRHDPNQPDLF